MKTKILYILITIFPVICFSGSIHLESYKPKSKAFALKGIGGNISGVTYNWDTDSYLFIQNNYAFIYEYDASISTLLRTIKIKGSKDTDFEDITYLGQGEYAIVNESNHVLIFNMKRASKGTINLNYKKKSVQQFTLPRPGKSNKGLEGICYSRDEKGGVSFFAVQEDKPKALYMFYRPRHKRDISARWWGELEVFEPFNIKKILKHKLKDLSGCYFSQSTNTLLLLSHESSALVELNERGKIISKLKLKGASQFEGVTINPSGEIVVVSEPNIVRVYKKQ